jgi:hypothetical protein
MKNYPKIGLLIRPRPIRILLAMENLLNLDSTRRGQHKMGPPLKMTHSRRQMRLQQAQMGRRRLEQVQEQTKLTLGQTLRKVQFQSLGS